METLASPLQSQSQALGVPNLPLLFSLFLIIYLVAYLFVFRGWTQKTRPEASSCAISFFHGTPAAILASAALISDPDRGFSAANTSPQSFVLDYSIAYFLVDLLHYAAFFPGDLLFVAHHLCTLFVFATCRYLVRRGAFAVLVLLILAEATSFCQNVWTLARARRAESPVAAGICRWLSPPFYGLYSVVRGLLGPWFVYRMGAFFVGGSAEGVIPRWVWVSWLAVVVTAISVSILWVSNLWIELYRERCGKLEKKFR